MPTRKKKSKNEFWKIDIVLGAFVFLSLVVIVKLFYIQVIAHEKYVELAQSQHVGLVEIPAKRGKILSRDSFTLAGIQTHYLLYAEPKRIEDPEVYAKTLAEILAQIEFNRDASSTKPNLEVAADGTPQNKQNIVKEYEEEILQLLNLDLYWVALKRDLTKSERDLIEGYDLKYVGFEDQPVRYYPEGTFAAHVLGFVAQNSKGEQQGYFGIEGAFDGDLKGKAGRIIQEKDALGAPILIGQYKKVNSIDGRDVVLTIDRVVQYLVEKKLKEAVDYYDAESGTIIVMDPMTSEIIAMANYPTYNPENFNEPILSAEKEEEIKTERRNLAISYIYEPGSVIKPFTVAAAVDMGLVSPSSTFVDEGPVRYSDYYIDNWDNRHYGVQTVVELLQRSNNIGAAWVGDQVGSKDLHRYFIDFGFNEPTGIELEGEDSGVIRDYKEWTDIDLATVSFGQGMSATPLQVLNAFNVLVNGGVLYQPKIIDSVIEEDRVLEMPVRKVRRVISEKASKTMDDLLVQAVESYSATGFDKNLYKVGGKTGTAQIPIGGKYTYDETNATFLGYLSGSKKFSMLVKFEQPKRSIYAAQTAAPVFFNLTGDLIKYYGITPD